MTARSYETAKEARVETTVLPFRIKLVKQWMLCTWRCKYVCDKAGLLYACIGGNQNPGRGQPKWVESGKAPKWRKCCPEVNEQEAGQMEWVQASSRGPAVRIQLQGRVWPSCFLQNYLQKKRSRRGRDFTTQRVDPEGKGVSRNIKSNKAFLAPYIYFT